jgi:hypothetical protein
MGRGIFESYIKDKLPREDDRKLFEELYQVYLKQGKEALTKHLKEIITELEG